MQLLTQVRVLSLNDGEHSDSALYRLEKNWQLQFRLGPSLQGHKVHLYCNYPEKKEDSICEFDRNRYYLLEWQKDEGCSSNDDTTLYTQLTVEKAGSFHFYYIYENA